MPSPFGLWANGESGGEEIADPTTAMSHHAGGCSRTVQRPLRDPNFIHRNCELNFDKMVNLFAAARNNFRCFCELAMCGLLKVVEIHTGICPKNG
jgi:hypothetical protein